MPTGGASLGLRVLVDQLHDDGNEFMHPVAIAVQDRDVTERMPLEVVSCPLRARNEVDAPAFIRDAQFFQGPFRTVGPGRREFVKDVGHWALLRIEVFWVLYHSQI